MRYVFLASVILATLLHLMDLNPVRHAMNANAHEVVKEVKVRDD